MKKIKYQFEYFCSPIWIKENNGIQSIYENINIVNAPLNDNLKRKIEELDKIYQSTYNDNYPPEPIQLSNEEDLFFSERVLKSYIEMDIELNNQYDLEFNKSYWIERLSKLSKTDTGI